MSPRYFCHCGGWQLFRGLAILYMTDLIKITADYLARIIASQNRKDDSEETLILSEELQK